jgi:hypothetical protein
LTKQDHTKASGEEVRSRPIIAQMTFCQGQLLDAEHLHVIRDKHSEHQLKLNDSSCSISNTKPTKTVTIAGFKAQGIDVSELGAINANMDLHGKP